MEFRVQLCESKNNACYRKQYEWQIRSVGTRVLFMLGEVDAAESKWADTMNSASTELIILFAEAKSVLLVLARFIVLT